jgi:hypothetical protein
MREVPALSLALLCLACACGVPAVRGGVSGSAPAGDATVAARQYVVEHRAQLEREIERGSGEALSELSIIADCLDLPELGRTLKRKHAEIFPVPPPSDPEVADRIIVLLRARSELVCRDLERGPTRPFSAGRHRVYTSAESGRAPRLGALSVGRRGEPFDR